MKKHTLKSTIAILILAIFFSGNIYSQTQKQDTKKTETRKKPSSGKKKQKAGSKKKKTKVKKTVPKSTVNMKKLTTGLQKNFMMILADQYQQLNLN